MPPRVAVFGFANISWQPFGIVCSGAMGPRWSGAHCELNAVGAANSPHPLLILL